MSLRIPVSVQRTCTPFPGMANLLPQLSIFGAGCPGRTELVVINPQGRVWRYRQAGATDTRGRQRSGRAESRGATEHTGEPGGLPWVLTLSPAFRVSTSSQNTEQTRKGPKKGSNSD